MLQKPASVVLAALKASTWGSRARHTYPLPCDRNERFTRSLVCTSSAFRSLRAVPGERRVLARRGWAGETVSFFNILRALTAHIQFLGVGPW